MPVLQSLSPVLFHGDTIFVVEHQGEPFAPMRPIIENMGLSWASQHKKLSKNRSRWGVEYVAVPTAGGLQTALCIPVRKLALFLAGVNPLKAGEQIRLKIDEYRKECAEALRNFWNAGNAKTANPTTFQPVKPDQPLDDRKPQLITESERDLLNTIKELDANNRELSAKLETTKASYTHALESQLELLYELIKVKTDAMTLDNTLKMQHVLKVNAQLLAERECKGARV